ncbi:hypothetical protein BGZ76_000585 [Entomortierella beljakovae]|nr:hypothetical protein BGZ76_000585 [Entomortierella beljakovae]
MATYKQPRSSRRYISRASPELDSIASFSNVSNNLSHNNATEEFSIEQEWTSTRHSNSARVKARQQLYLHQEQQQRAQEWSFVLEKLEQQHNQEHHHHQHSSSSPVIKNTSQNTLHLENISVVQDVDEDESGTESLFIVNSIDEKPTSLLRPPQRPHIFTRASSIGLSSIQSYSDLGSDELEGLDELEDFSVWSQDEEDVTMIQSRNNKIPKSPSEISISSFASFNNNKTRQHPSFVYRTAVAVADGSQSQSQMPFHDGSGNFFSNQNLLSQQGSDYESDVTGWDSSSSSCSKPKYQRSSTSRRSTRSRHHKPISLAEFESTIQNISLLQAQYHSSPSTSQKSLNGETLSTTSTASSSSYDQYSSHNIPRSTSHYRIRKPIGPSKLSKCSIYESEIEDMEAMLNDVSLPSSLSSHQGWLETIRSTLSAIQMHKSELGVEDSTIVSASSLEALQSLQMRHKAGCQEIVDSRRISSVPSCVDPMQIQFSPTLRSHSHRLHPHHRMDKSTSIATQTMDNPHQAR